MERERQPAVAGRFYPAEPARLEKDVERYLSVPDDVSKEPAIGIVGPHAGYMFSGATAGHTWARVTPPESAIILGPNHTGLGPSLSIWSEGHWLMPMGKAPIAETLAERIVGSVSGLAEEPLAHLREHGIEVHIPFLQAVSPNANFVPIVCGFDDRQKCRQIGHALASIIQDSDEDTLLVASTDMSHFISASKAHELDHEAIQHIVDLDPDGLYKTVRSKGITMCGVIPTTIVLDAAIQLGAQSVEFVEYTHSGMVTGDNQSVVGYAGLVIRG